MSNKTINTLAETMNASEFINEMGNRNVSLIFDEIDNIMDFNEGIANVIVDDVAYLFIDGKLDSVSY